MTMETDRETRREAYDMGHNDAMTLTTAEVREMTREAQEADQAVSENFSHYTETARWANAILPQLRALAGYDDPAGHGTHTAGGQAASWRLDEVVEAYRDGYIDKTLGYDRYQSRPHLMAGREA
jgi:hypothetical protein